jgi:hypothetical protein
MLPFLVANFKSGMLPPPQSSGVFCTLLKKLATPWLGTLKKAASSRA